MSNFAYFLDKIELKHYLIILLNLTIPVITNAKERISTIDLLDSTSLSLIMSACSAHNKNNNNS